MSETTLVLVFLTIDLFWCGFYFFYVCPNVETIKSKAASEEQKNRSDTMLCRSFLVMCLLSAVFMTYIFASSYAIHQSLPKPSSLSEIRKFTPKQLESIVDSIMK